jgi:hypothetical protein
MPSPLVHTAVAAASARLADKLRLNRAALVFCAVAANAADLDMIPGLLLAGDPVRFHHLHSHTLAFALALAFVMSFFSWGKEGPGRKARFLALLASAASHPLLDLLTTDTHRTFSGQPYGMMLAWPFTDRRWLGPAVFDGAFMPSRWQDVFHAANLKIAAFELVVGAVILAFAWAAARPKATSPSAAVPARTTS